VAPVEHVVFVHLAHAERDVDERIEVAPAGFDQQHARGAILAQPVGQHAAGRAGADDHVVVAFLHAHPRCSFLHDSLTVVPAQAGTHNHRLWNMGPRLRGDDSIVDVEGPDRAHTSSVLAANISSSSTRRALSPCSCTYCAMVSSTAREALKP